MTDKTAFVPTRLTPAELEARKQAPLRPPVKGPTFGDALRDAERTTAAGQAPDVSASGSGLRFSAHAEARLRTRDIRLTPADAAQIDQAVQIAEAKGAQSSLILYDDLALIVSIRNKLVITALECGESAAGAGANVFTHIDSAVVVTGSRT
jgi:flagellar operon protein